MSNEILKQKVLDLRQSNVVFGADHHPMTSIQQKDFTTKSANPPASSNNNAIRQTNLILGDAPSDFQSINQHIYVEHLNAPRDFSAAERSLELKGIQIYYFYLFDPKQLISHSEITALI